MAEVRMSHWDDNERTPFNNCFELDSIPQFYNFFNIPDGFKIVHNNIRSYSKNFEEMLVYLDSLPSVDVIVLSECWLSGGERGSDLEGYDLVMTDRQRNQNDGVTVYIDKRLSATATQISLGDVYGISLTFTFSLKPTNILAIYRTFDSDTDSFLDALGNYYDNLSKDTTCIFIGDINIDLLLNTPLTDSYLNCLLGAGLEQCVDKPTRVTDISISCIDHIFVRYNDMTHVRSAVLHTSITDHFSTALTIATPAAPTHKPPAAGFTNTDTYIDRTLLAHNLAHSDWTPVLSSLDVVVCSNEFSKTIQTSTELSKKPVNVRNTRFEKLKPWISSDLIRLIRVRDRLSKVVKKQPFKPDLKMFYGSVRQNFSKSLKLANKNYYRNEINKSGKKSKNLLEVG